VGLYKHYRMENTKKIVGIYLVLLFFISCTYSIKNKNYLIKKKNELYFKHRTFSTQIKQEGSFKEEDTVFFKNVYYEGKMISNKEIIDPGSFDLLYNDSSMKNQVNNEFYLRGGNDYYFKDKNYIYMYRDDITKEDNFPFFFVAGKSNNYKVLGGAYLQIKDEIYCKGELLNEADVKTFKTAKMRLQHSEWFITIGFDKRKIYLENRKIDKSQLHLYVDRIYEINTDSLSRMYK